MPETTHLVCFRYLPRARHAATAWVSAILLAAGTLFGCSDDGGHGGQNDAAVDALPDGDLDAADASDGEVPPRTDCVGETFDPCTPAQGTNNAVLLTGTVLTADSVICNGQVLFDSQSERIQCVDEDCTQHQLAADATVICADIILPGLIDPHNHMTYNTLPIWRHPGVLYEDRDQWRTDPDFNAYDGRLSSTHQNVADRYSEFRLLMSGTTAVHKSSSRTATYTGVRNLDRGPDGNDLGLPSDAIEECVFPLSGSCFDKPDYTQLDPNLRAYVAHVSEGFNQYAYDEFQDFVDDGQLGYRTAIVHGISFDSNQLAQIASAGGAMLWSPQSNADLYGQTTNVPAAVNMGVAVAIGPDWTLSGTMNLLTELKCAAHINQKYYGDAFSAQDLVMMVTGKAALALGIDDLIGYLRPGHFADVAALTGDREHPYEAVIQSNSDGVRAAFIGGLAFYGDADALHAGIEFNAFCETISVCGVDKRICVKEEAGDPPQPLNVDDWARFRFQDYTDYLQARLDEMETQDQPLPEDEYLYDLYPLFDCAPYYACDLGNAYVSGNPTVDDNDGDDVLNAQDNCPDVFNPNQGDLDNDGVGDSCDECPYAADPTDCPIPDPSDRDGDTVPNVDDNCPDHANTNQDDGDNDGIGDVCDACPQDPNPNGAPCPATIYEVKTGVFAPGDTVGIDDALVTAVAQVGFFVQVPANHPDYNGSDHSGVYVYTGSSGPFPARGDRVYVSAQIQNWFGQIQLSSMIDLNVLTSGNPSPTPVSATPVEIGLGGTRASTLEAVLVEVADVTVTSFNTTLGEFVVDSALTVDDFLYLANPFPAVDDTYLGITGVLQWTFDDSKLEPRDATDILAGPPRLTAVEPALSFAYEGQTAVPLPDLTVRLNRPALANTNVNLTTSDASVLSVPAFVTVLQGQSTAQVSVTGVAASPTPVTLTAELDTIQATSLVRVLSGTEQPSIISLEPSLLQISVNTADQFVATLDLPARAGGETLDATMTPAGLATMNSSFFVPAGQFSVVVPVTSSDATGTATVEVGLGASLQQATLEVLELPLTGLILVQVFYDSANPSADDGYEWVQLYNGSSSAVDLSGFSIGWGGTDYTYGTMQLSGVIPAFGCFIAGGPQANAGNGNPTYDLAQDFNQDIQNGGSASDGVALFDVPAAAVTSSTVPIDAVIYDSPNTNNLMDETGNPGTSDVGDAPSGSALVRDATDHWVIAAPDPLNCPAF